VAEGTLGAVDGCEPPAAGAEERTVDGVGYESGPFHGQVRLQFVTSRCYRHAKCTVLALIIGCN
jgi:hypothetical protein